jgi:hypothetical protein
MSTSKDDAKYYGKGDIKVEIHILNPTNARNVMEISTFHS